MSGFDKSMMDALRADAEKLSQLTGEDHSIEFFDFEEDFEEDDDGWDDCALRADGQCGMAGTEWCDFECPNRDSEHFAGSAAWIATREKAGGE